MKRTLVLAALVLGLVAWVAHLGIAHAQDAKALSEAMDAVRNAAADRDLGGTEEAFQTLDRLRPGLDTLDEARLLLAKTRMVAGRYADAAETVAQVVEREKSPWHVKALYLTAEASARRRQWKHAADVYARRVEWASSDAHKSEIAQLYREIADGAFLGDVVTDAYGREKRVPDWRTARRFYDKARSTRLETKDGAVISHRIAKSALESGDPRAAAKEWTQLLDGDPGEFADDAVYGLGLAQLRLGLWTEARRSFRTVRTESGDSPFAPLSWLREAESWRPLRNRSEDDLRMAVKSWREFLRLHPDHEKAADTAWGVADVFSRFGKPREAADAFGRFLGKFPDEDRAPAAQDRIAQAYLSLGEFDRAVSEWQKLLAGWPNHPLWARAQSNVALASFLKGKTAFDEKDKDGEAQAALTAFLEAFPVDPRAPDAQLLLGDVSSRGKRHEAAVDAWRLVTTKYPASAAAPKGALRIASAYEGPLEDLEKALAAYEDVVAKWPHSPEGREARTVLVQMKGKMLEVKIARAFRTDEKAAVPVRIRNVSRLRMKAYAVDGADYVARKGGLAGVEQVEVDIVKPDHEWTFEVPDFEKYRLLERSCPLPFTRPGAYIVTAAEEELTAKFLVVVSDLTCIVKAAAGQALVFVYDERTGEPVSGARVRLLDGDLRGVTGRDGVYLVDDKKVGRVRAVVTGEGSHQGHFAFADGTPAGTKAFGYAPKVFLHTDRPLYRPGSAVEIRGIVRRVADGRYVTEKGLKIPVQVIDPRGAMLLDRKLVTDEYGVIAHQLQLAGEPSLGTYTVNARIDGRAYTRTFDVLAYRKPDVLVTVRPDESVYLAGDEVKATIGLKFAVGGNVSGAEVRWSVLRGPFTFDPSVHEAFSWFFRDAKREEELQRRRRQGMQQHASGTGLTNEDGALDVSFVSDLVEEDRTYTIYVEARDPNRQWVQSAASVPVTRRGAYVICRTEKKVYRPGQTIRLEVTTVNPLHSPLSLEGEGVLIRRTLKGQHFVENEVGRAKAKTGDDGRATVDLTADKPGEYRFVFETKDAGGNVVSGGAPVTLSGDAEDLAKQARLVADREFYREGDVAKVLVNVPVAPAPVLLTYEGEKILEYRVFMATERSNTIEMPLTSDHAPNVFLRMAVAKGGELFEDGDEVAVFQYLNVSVTPSATEVKPGEKVSITVRTTDQLGRPVRAEVSLDVVDSALYQLAPDATPQIKPFFYDQRRTHGVRTASSSGGAFPAVTRPTNKDLLFEQMRRLGRERFEEMKKHVQLGRELLEGGDRKQARRELARALEIAPGNYEARALLDRLDRQQDKLKDARDRPPAARAPRPSKAVAAESRSVSDAMPAEEMEGNGLVGLGGGGGGKFGGRRGGRARREAKKGFLEDDDQDGDGGPGGPSTPGGAFRQNRDGDFRARTENVFDRALDNKLVGMLRLAQSAAPMVPAELRKRFADTAHSTARVRTGKDGIGRVEVELPDNLTDWKVTARGASAGPLVGEGSTSFRAAKKLLVRANMPRFLTQGDTTTGTGTVHSDLDEEVQVKVSFQPDRLDLRSGAAYDVTLSPGEVRPFDVGVGASKHGLAGLKAEVLSSVESDAARIALPVVPYGLRRLDGASGLLTEEAFAKLNLPADAVEGTVSLTVSLSPSIDVSLLESLAYTGSYPWGCVEQTVNRFLPALAARRALGDTGSWNQRRKDRLDRSVEQGLSALYALQNDDGSFGWFGARRRGSVERRGSASAENTAYAVLGLVRAELAGYRVSRSNRDRAVAAAARLVPGSSVEDRAFLLYALSYAKAATLAELNKLYRARDSLKSRGLALLALTMHRTKRPGNALTCVQLLSSRAKREGGFVSWDAAPTYASQIRRHLRYRPVNVEPTAYALLAFLAVEPSDPVVDGAARWIAVNRRGPAWRSTRDTAAAVEALAAHAKHTGVRRAECEVQVFVGDGTEPVGSVKFGGPGTRPVDAPTAISIPASALKAGDNKIVLRKSGGGEVHWSALLAAVVKPKADEPIPAGGVLMSVAREYTEWVAPRAPGETVEQRIIPGWGVVVSKHRPKNWHGRGVSLAGTGDKVKVTLTVRSKVRLDRVILEDPLPAGFEVVRDSAAGNFDREERRDDRQVFFFSRVHRTQRVTYVIQAIHPGAYRALPATARPMYEPEIHGWSRESRITVDPRPGLVGRPPSSETITPDEIWGLALRAFANQDWSGARSGIEALMAKYELVKSVQEEAYWRLFVIGIELGDADLTVKSFESLVERNPRRAPTGLRHRRLLAKAYQGLGENERALSIYRDLGRELYAWDKEVAAAYGSIGNPWRQRTLTMAALARQSDAAWVEAEELALARVTTGMRAASPIADAEDGSPTRMVPGTSNAQPLLLNDAVQMFRSFQAHHASSRLAHDAGYLAVQSLLRMGLHAEAIAEGARFLRRHKASPYLDDTTYLVAEGHFRAADYDDALRAARPLLTETFPRDDDPAKRVVSPFRSRAIHLTAKVAHLRGRLAKAVDLYRQVENLFPDAKDAREFLTRTGLELREVEAVAVGHTPTLHLKRKNVPEVKLKAYAVDFMILYALRRNLSGVNKIDLSGVKPHHEWTVARRGPEDYRWHEEDVKLPATEKGVYLVVAGGGGLDASSVVLVSDLEVSVQITGGRLRIYTTRRDTGAPWGEVYVKVGDGNQIKAQGFTDARGVFEAGAVGGSFSVVAEEGGNVALWRR